MFSPYVNLRPCLAYAFICFAAASRETYTHFEAAWVRIHDSVYFAASGREVQGTYGLGSLENWDRGFESRSRHE